MAYIVGYFYNLFYNKGMEFTVVISLIISYLQFLWFGWAGENKGLGGLKILQWSGLVRISIVNKLCKVVFNTQWNLSFNWDISIQGTPPFTSRTKFGSGKNVQSNRKGTLVPVPKARFQPLF